MFWYCIISNEKEIGIEMPEMVSSNLHLLLNVACTLWSIKIHVGTCCMLTINLIF